MAENSKDWKFRISDTLDILQIILLISVILGWFNSLHATADQVNRLESSVAVLQEQFQRIESRSSRLETGIAVLQEQIESYRRGKR